MDVKIEHEIQTLWREGDILIYGLTGQAGAGKTSSAEEVVSHLREQNIPAASLGLDAYFILSSAERKAWLAEGERVSPAEGKRRRNQLLWWDFQALQCDLLHFKQGEPIQLRGVYNREDKGEKTRNIDIVPDERRGFVLVLEGVALAHVEVLDGLAYVHAPADVRYLRIQMRDSARRPIPAEAWNRFRLTQEFEIPYFRAHWEKIRCFFDNSNGVGPLKVSILSPEEALNDLERPPLL
ncbi:MAG: hypothetical protein A3B74_03600 [Candidatus Kerfeldbacteria bacterium RIFCSPHIGHO2_02_FULL_42_14]|uniref:Phosphoribulokinase/uridine kinase domain-containing protein n=1 Tax=Candidatus Kerfeldbacteria bacterium RIFCSPHIGHO2_02_FULL_42_14 TaxID=1798540 RepID=A0A1G2AQX9_9BACT|nr:MAG: hypothetical protein A3B74_03600 [Candidatus Kerfeldbacteria bacterium RIFCSPHIGHO2_02_FULL_42_14]OGY80602.1 MAG: hypothetical protein A3E60_04095 [Candidatus Kerfeldbacteria bacterium RIFCSPHIGHO2_12_FULL_42_13]OGY82526.1 MAG: hypothetical protein A3I91_03760 [Candidatus Kerfeldbacteria bacterium RIFCSPLOWO2_02_FULL_42_19]OGY87552.1 MAG: hypothetical protein A3G01_00840 [Candidatus Kerfeldbacteria bacterium RIFCSPLOWO2_12_FULL_43_9]